MASVTGRPSPVVPTEGTRKLEVPLGGGAKAVVLMPEVTAAQWGLFMSVLDAAKPSFLQEESGL